jgi:hypothetical protein
MSAMIFKSSLLDSRSSWKKLYLARKELSASRTVGSRPMRTGCQKPPKPRDEAAAHGVSPFARVKWRERPGSRCSVRLRDRIWPFSGTKGRPVAGAITGTGTSRSASGNRNGRLRWTGTFSKGYIPYPLVLPPSDAVSAGKTGTKTVSYGFGLFLLNPCGWKKRPANENHPDAMPCEKYAYGGSHEKRASPADTRQ